MDIPKNWKKTNLKDVVNYQKGKKPSVLQETEFVNSAPYLDIKALEKGEIRQYADLQSSVLLDKTSVAMVWDGARSGWVSKGKFGALGSTLAALKPIETDVTYLFYFLKSQFEFINTNVRGIGIPHVDPEKIWTIQFPQAPFIEQKQISKKLDEIFGHLDLLNTRLDRIPELISAFKEKVLTYAVTGKLTEELRRKQTNKEWPKKAIDQIAELVSGYAFKSSSYTDDGYQLIRMGNLYQDKLDLTRNPVFIPRTTDKVLIEKYSARKGDILLSLTGTKYKRDYGYAVQIENIEKTLLVNQRILCLRPKINKEYLLYVLRTNIFRDQFFSFETGGVNQGNVGSSAFSKILIPIPPAEEQELIVTKIKELFSLIDKINLHFNDCQKLFENMPGNLFNKAFTGNLLKEKSITKSVIEINNA